MTVGEAAWIGVKLIAILLVVLPWMLGVGLLIELAHDRWPGQND